MAVTIQPELYCRQQRWFARQRPLLLNPAMTTFAERVSIAIDNSQKKQIEIAREEDIPQQALSGIIKRNSEGSSYTARIARACGVDAYWLETGKGQMLPAGGADLDNDQLKLARAWRKLPDFKMRGYLQAIMTDATLLEVFPEVKEAMRTAAIATDPEYHKLTEGFRASRKMIEAQGKLFT